MKLAVFGHYNSRGGTIGMPLPDQPTEADVRAAIRKYDRDLFGIEEPSEPIQTTAYGMEARVCDQMAHSIIYGNESPGESDFMWVAEIHGDLPEGDLEDEGGHVLIDESTELEDGPGRAEWMKRNEAATAGLEGQTWLDANSAFDARDPMPTYDVAERVMMSLERPVQLEFVKAPDGFDDDIKAHEKALDDEAAGQGMWVHGFSSEWTPEQVKEHKRWTMVQEGYEAVRNYRIKQLAKVLKGDEVEVRRWVRRWDDDAYGFLIGTGM